MTARTQTMKLPRQVTALRRWMGIFALVLLMTAAQSVTLFAQADAGAADDTAAQSTEETAGEVPAIREPGVLIVEVQADSPAAEAGLTRGDILLSFDDIEIDDAAALIAAIQAAEPGAEVEIAWLHGSEMRTATLEPADRDGLAFLGVRPHWETTVPDNLRDRVGARFQMLEDAEGQPRGRMILRGMLMERINPDGAWAEDAEELHGRLMILRGMAGDTDGVVILDVLPGSPADESGLASGSIIVAMNGEPVGDPQALQAAVQALSPQDEITLEVYAPDADEAAEIVVTLDASEADAEVAFLGVRLLPAMPRHTGMMSDEWGMHSEMREGMHGMRGHRMGEGMGMMMPRGRHFAKPATPEEGATPGMGRFGMERFGMSRFGGMYQFGMRIPFMSRFHGWMMDRWGIDMHEVPMFRFFAGPAIEGTPESPLQPEAGPRFRFEETPRLQDFF